MHSSRRRSSSGGSGSGSGNRAMKPSMSHSDIHDGGFNGARSGQAWQGVGAAAGGRVRLQSGAPASGALPRAPAAARMHSLGHSQQQN